MRKNSFAAYASGLWCIEPNALEAFCAEFQQLCALRSPELIAAAKEYDEALAPSVAGESVAVLSLSGPILKRVPGWARFMGLEAIDASEVASALYRLAADDSVSKVFINIDSPGGQVSGTEEMASALGALAESKDVHVHASDMCCSAALWFAAGANKISANSSANVGSVGVYASVADYSGLFEKEGIKVHVVSTGDEKGRLVEGTEITERDLEVLQREVNKVGDLFIGAVAKGRGMEISAVAKLATGRTWLGEEAKALGLIDEVSTLAAAVAAFTAPTGAEDGEDMSEETTQAAPEVGAEVEAEAENVELLKAKAEAEAAKAALSAYKAEQKEKVIKAGVESGKITPALLPSVKKHAELCELDELVAFVDCLPKQTRDVPSGAAEAPVASGGLSAVQKQFAEKWNIEEEYFAQAAELEG